jgi:hypothetical protein
MRKIKIEKDYIALRDMTMTEIENHIEDLKSTRGNVLYKDLENVIDSEIIVLEKELKHRKEQIGSQIREKEES